MKYLLVDYAEPMDICIGRCKCKSTDCNEYECGTDTCFMNKEGACPSHCWAQVCTTAKVDPFSFNV